MYISKGDLEVYMFEKTNGNMGVVTLDKMEALHQMLNKPDTLREYLSLLEGTKRACFTTLKVREAEFCFSLDTEEEELKLYITNKLNMLCKKEIDEE